MFTKGFTPMKVNDVITKFISASQNLHWVFRCSFRPAARAPLKACSLVKKLKWKNVVREVKTWVVSVVRGSRLWIKNGRGCELDERKQRKIITVEYSFLLIIVGNYNDRLKPIQIPLLLTLIIRSFILMKYVCNFEEIVSGEEYFEGRI